MRNKRPTCCAAVLADGELELLPGCGNLEVVVHGVDSLGAHTQLEPQLVPSGSVGQLVDLVQTWGGGGEEGVIDVKAGGLVLPPKKRPNSGALTEPELLCHVAKACRVLPPALQKVQPASRTSLEHLRGSSSMVSLTLPRWKHFSKETAAGFRMPRFLSQSAGWQQSRRESRVPLTEGRKTVRQAES